MSAAEVADRLGAPASCVERKIATLNLPRCPPALRAQRARKKTLQWPKYRVVIEIAKLYRQGKANGAFLQKHHKSLYMAAVKRFGSYRAAVEAAGIDYDDVNLYAWRRKWDRKDIIEEIQRMHAEGISLRAGHARDQCSAVFNAARREFKTWGAAITAAGFDYSKIRGARWGALYQGVDGYEYKSEVEGKVGDRLHRLEARGVLAKVYRQVRVTSNRGWRCDFVAELPAGEVIWIEVDGLGTGRADGAYDEKHPKIKYYKRKGFSFAVVRSPGQAEKVIRRGLRGLVSSPRDSPRKIIQLGDNRYTDDDIIQEVRRVGQQLGHAPTTAEFIKWGRITPQTVSRRVGWNRALLRAGYLPRRKVSKQVLLDELRRVISEMGRAPSRSSATTRGTSSPTRTLYMIISMPTAPASRSAVGLTHGDTSSRRSKPIRSGPEKPWR